MCRYILVFLMLSFTTNGWTQSSIIEEGFEDGNFTSSPSWTGDIAEFIVIEGEPNHLLQLQGDPSGGSSYLSTASTEVIGSWEFYFRYNASSAPSGSNKASIFLMSDRADLEGEVNGYAVQVGRTGDDTFELVRYDDGTATDPILSDTTIIYHNSTGYRVRVIREAGGQWQLEVGQGYSGRLYNSGLTITDNTHPTSSFFGVQVNYTSTRANQFYFDFKIDLPPFSLTSVSPVTDASIQVTFNRDLQETEVSPADFSMDQGVGSPSAVTLLSANALQLHFPGPLPSNKYRLTVSGIEDMAGNTFSSTSTSFIIYGSYTGEGVHLNEFMYDPPPGLPEYIEIHNSSDQYLDLAEWQIGDQLNTITIGSGVATVEPNGFLIISADTVALFETFGHRPYSILNLPALNNSGDKLRLITADGIIADSLVYTSAWGGRGVALERRTITAPGHYAENWDESSTDPGSPGLTNTVPADDSPPGLEVVEAVDSSTLQLIFSERVSQVSAGALENYRLTPQHQIQRVTVQKDTVRLVLAEPLVSTETYSVTVTNISDIFGNIASERTDEVLYREFGIPKNQDIVLNEIMYKPGVGKGAEFVELFNRSDRYFDLSHWQLADASTVVSLPPNISLGPKEYLVLTGNPSFARSFPNAKTISGFPSLNDAGDLVYLSDSEGTVMDSLNYLSSWGNNMEATSLERKDPEAASNDAQNWQSSSARAGHSAGLKNAAFHTDLEPPVPIFSKITSEGRIEVVLNEFIDLSQDTRFRVEEISLSVVQFNAARANRIVLAFPAGQNNPLAHSITAENLADVKGNRTAIAEVSIAYPLQPSEVVINEIMYRPLSDPNDNRPDQSEYLELRNTTDFAVSLEGLVLHDAPDEQGNLRVLHPITSVTKWIPPQGVALIYPDSAAAFEQSNIATFFDIEPTFEHPILRVDRTSLSLASSGDALYIADSTGTTIDSVYYEESWQNPNIYDTRGIALERISPTGPSNSDTNWGSNITARGGSPLAENSIFQTASPPLQRPGLTFSPNPFSPDDDGYEDHLFIHYQLEEPDYLLRAEVYDRYGRFITKLADGVPAGFEGTLMWDGRKENGGSNAIGIYIVILEAYDSQSGNNKAFKQPVVLARQFN